MKSYLLTEPCVSYSYIRSRTVKEEGNAKNEYLTDGVSSENGVDGKVEWTDARSYTSAGDFKQVATRESSKSITDYSRSGTGKSTGDRHNMTSTKEVTERRESQETYEITREANWSRTGVTSKVIIKEEAHSTFKGKSSFTLKDETDRDQYDRTTADESTSNTGFSETDTIYTGSYENIRTDIESFTPHKIIFQSSIVETSCRASHKTTIAIEIFGDLTTQETYVSAKSKINVLTTIPLIGESYTYPVGSPNSMREVPVSRSQTNGRFQTVSVCEFDERIITYQPTQHKFPKLIALMKSLTKGAKVPEMLTGTGGTGVTSSSAYNTGTNPRRDTLSFTSARTQHDFAKTRSYFNPTKYSSYTRGSTKIITYELEYQTLTKTEAVTLYDYVHYSDAGIKTVSQWNMNINTMGFKGYRFVGTSTNKATYAKEFSSSTSETFESSTDSSTRNSTNKESVGDTDERVLFDRGLYQSSLSIGGSQFGAGFHTNPAVQTSYGTAGDNYANIEGMTFPLMGANHGTHQFNYYAEYNKRSHDGYGIPLFTNVSAFKHTNIFTGNSNVRDSNGNYQQVTTTYSNTRITNNSNFRYPTYLGLDVAKQAFSLTVFRYKYDFTNSVARTGARRWYGFTDQINNFTLVPDGTDYVLGNFELDTPASDVIFEETSYEVANPIYASTVTDAPFSLVGFTAMNLSPTVAIMGGIDATGGGKTGWVYPITFSENGIVSTVNDAGGLVAVSLPMQGISSSGTAVTTVIAQPPVTFSHADGGKVQEACGHSTTGYYKDFDTNWTNSRIVIHDYDLPVGASFANGIVFVKGKAPVYTVVIENPQDPVSDHRTGLTLDAPAQMPTTILESDWLDRFFSTQWMKPHIGT